MPESAPNQVAYFIKTAQAGGYDGTTFHAMFKNGMVQGGDPLSKDPDKRSAGTGGQNAVKAEARAASITAGSVAAVLVPGQPDSAGAQFYIFLADQPSLANQLTVFGKVADGMEVLQKISEAPLDASRHAVDRIEITRVTIRDTPPEPFVNETAQQLSAHRAVLDTSSGPSRSSCWPTRLPKPFVSFSGWWTPASTTGWRSTASRRASSFRPARCRAAWRRFPAASRTSCTTCRPSSTTRST